MSEGKAEARPEAIQRGDPPRSTGSSVRAPRTHQKNHSRDLAGQRPFRAP